jgi:uncharacterized protein (DUF433 family)
LDIGYCGWHPVNCWIDCSGKEGIMEPIQMNEQDPMLPEAPASMLDHYIVADPDTLGGRARISGTRISIADLVIMHLRLGRSLEEISVEYDIPLAGVYAGMAYYFDNRSEVDRSINDDRTFAEAFRQSNPSPLKEKLASLTRG